MYVRRNLTTPFILRYVWPDLLWTTAYTLLIFWLFFFENARWIDLPFELISAVGIAISFLIGFKNNQAYDRFWEGRKIWGQIVNFSRMWGMQVVAQIGRRDPGHEPVTDEDLREIHRVMIYRWVAWINALRVQLRARNNWAVKENVLVERFVNRHRDDTGVPETIAPFVKADELEMLKPRVNIATHLVKNLAIDLDDLRRRRLIDGFDMLIMMETVNKAYDLQGMCERIKNTPFPRQFAFFSKLFTVAFCLLLPLGLVDLLEQAFLFSVEYSGTFGVDPDVPAGFEVFLFAPLSIAISCVFLTWEKIGDSSEEPFEERPFDVSMTALCRTIEIDLRDMLEEKDLPPKIGPKDHILY